MLRIWADVGTILTKQRKQFRSAIFLTPDRGLRMSRGKRVPGRVISAGIVMAVVRFA